MRHTQLTREFFTVKSATRIKPKACPGLEFRIYDDAAGRPYALAFWGKSIRPLWHHRFKTPAQRERQVAETIANYTAHLQRVAANRAERAKPHNLQVGHILTAVWGYDQTNIDFYEVTKIIGRRMVELRAIRQTVIAAREGGADYVAPLPGEFAGAPMRKVVSYGRVTVDSCRSASVWSGAPAYQTAAGWGH